MFTLEQIEQISKVVSDNHSIFILQSLGSKYLSKDTTSRLEGLGIVLDKKSQTPFVKQTYHLGILNRSLDKDDRNKFDFEDLKKYTHNETKLSVKESKRLQLIELQVLKDIRNLESKISSEITQSLINSYNNPELNINQNLETLSLSWEKSFNRILQYNVQSAYEEGKSVGIQRTSKDPDPFVYKQPYKDACKYCKKAYLREDGFPRIFRLSELRKNGTNIGKKVDELKPTLDPLHVNCRCPLVKYNSKKEKPLVKKKILVGTKALTSYTI